VDAFSAAQAGISTNYRKQIGTATKALAEQVGWEHPVHLIAPADLLRFREDALAKLAPPTVRSYMLVLRRFFAFLHQEGWIRRNPAHKIRLPAPKGRKDHLRPHEVGPVLDAFWRVCPQIAPIATALVLGGWRKGEIVNLRHEDVDLAEGWAYVMDFEGDEFTEAWNAKTTASVRAVPLHPLVVRALERTARITRPDGWVSPWVFPVLDKRKRERYRDRRGRLNPARGDRRSPGTGFFGTKLREVLKAAKVDRPITIHGLRRTFAVLLQEAGAPDSVIRQALGHGQRGVTELNYLPRRDATVKRWVEAISVSVPALESPSIEPSRKDSE
jgi:integrase